MWNDKPDGYPVPARNPMGMGTGTNFYPHVWVRVRISTYGLFTGGWVITLPDPLPSLITRKSIFITSGIFERVGI
jgi:hypothetical protein